MVSASRPFLATSCYPRGRDPFHYSFGGRGHTSAPHWIRDYGAPAVIHSDQGANLCGDVVHSMCHLLSIQQTRISAYHPQGNGQVEWFNRTVQAILAKAVKDDQRDWDLHLPQALFAYRTSVQESTGFTPFLLTFGRSPKLPIDR